MSNRISNTPRSVTSRALANNFAQEEETRRDEMSLNRDFYYSQQTQTLNIVNNDQDPFVMNLVRPIVKKRASLLYANAPVREFEGPTESINKLEEVYANNMIDQLMQQIDLNAELTGSSLVTPVVDEEGEVTLKMFDASSISALTDDNDPQKLEALSILRVVDRVNKRTNQTEPGTVDVERVILQQIWTDDSVVFYEGEVLVETESHELGEIPFVNFKAEEVHDQYLGHAPARSIRQMNEQINQLLTDLAFAVKFQAFTPLAVTGYSGDSLITMHPGRALNLPAGATANTLSTDPKIDKVLAMIQYLEDKAYELNSVPKISVVGGGEANSGRELMIRWFPLVSVFNEKSLRFQKYELELANLILRVLGLPELTGLKVNYSLDGLLPFTEEEDTLDQDIRLNIKSPVDELMRRDPSLDEVEAFALLQVNRAINGGLVVSDETQEDVPEEEPEDQPENEPDEPGVV